MLRIEGACHFEHIGRADDIRLNICFWMLDAVADTGLRTQVDDDIRCKATKGSIQSGSVLEHSFNPGDPRVGREASQSSMLQCRVVIGREPIKTTHLMAGVEKAFRQMKSDEPGNAR